MIKLSPSQLSVFNDCPVCFWLAKNAKTPRPRGIFPSLPGGMDRVLKTFYDKCRAEGNLPASLVEKVKGKLMPDSALLDEWRNWRKPSIVYEDPELDVRLSGALDDCVITDDGHYVPLDYKTRGSRMKISPAEYSKKYYQTQLDCYTLMLDCNGFPTNGTAYLVYYWPVETLESGVFKFEVEPVLIQVDIEEAKDTVKRAVELINEPKIPDWAKKAATGCEQCSYVKLRGGE